MTAPAVTRSPGDRFGAIAGTTAVDLLGAGRTIYVHAKTGLPFQVEPWGATYLTPCCTATATIHIDDGALCCKACWGEAPSLCGTGPDPIDEIRPPTNRT